MAFVPSQHAWRPVEIHLRVSAVQVSPDWRVLLDTDRIVWATQRIEGTNTTTRPLPSTSDTIMHQITYQLI